MTTVTIDAVIADDDHVTVPPTPPILIVNQDDASSSFNVTDNTRDAGVQRVVLTSAFHAVSWGHPHNGHVFTEDDWTILDGPGVDAYGKSKTLAERAAWQFMADEGGAMTLATLPVAVMGPVMGDDVSGANRIVQTMLEGRMPGFPDLYIPIVDVRDVAIAHILAMTAADAAGQRLLLSNGPAIPMQQIGAVIKAHLGVDARHVPTRSLADMPGVPDLGYSKKTSNDKARRVLGWTPRDPRKAIVAAAESMVRKGFVTR